MARPHRPLPPCRCGHPGAGCSCYEERVAEVGWKSQERRVGQKKVKFPAPVNLGSKRRSANPYVAMEEVRQEAAEVDRRVCRECSETIKVMVFRGTGYCSERCRKSPS